MKDNNLVNKEIIQWGHNTLTSHGYILKSNAPELILNTPWSYVARFSTSNGYVYLKQTPELLGLEAPIIQTLRNTFQASVPKIIAHNAVLNCFLMEDAGTSLRGILKQTFDEALLCKAIDQFTSLQIAVSYHVDVFLNIGVPDWRLNKFPELYIDLISKKEILIADGLTEIEISALESLLPLVTNLCDTLSAYPIKQTIVQPDFNDNNILIDEQNITIIDLGELVISHPFFSLLNCLQQMKKHYAITEKDAVYQRIKEACLNNYMHFESKKHLSEAFETATVLFHLYGALANYRLMVACEKAKFTSSFQWQARPSISLRNFLTASTLGA